MKLLLFPWLGTEAITATIWLSFVVPVLVCEIALQWTTTSSLHRFSDLRTPKANIYTAPSADP